VSLHILHYFFGFSLGAAENYAWPRTSEVIRSYIISFSNKHSELHMKIFKQQIYMQRKKALLANTQIAQL